MGNLPCELQTLDCLQGIPIVPSIVHDGNMCKVHDVYSVSADRLLRFSLLARPRDVACILSEPMSKFHTVVSGCAGNIVVGDNAVLTVGSSPTDGMKMKFLT